MTASRATASLATRSGKFLVAGHPYAGYTKMISDAFAKIGYTAECLEYTVPQSNAFDIALSKASSARKSERNKRMTEACARAIEERVLEASPDYVLVIDGNELTDKTISYCSSHGTTLVMWAYDSVRNFPWISRAARNFEFVFTHEPEDLAAFPPGRTVKYLPLAYDPQTYFPSESPVDHDIDLVFAGAIQSNYPERTKRLAMIGRAFPEMTIRVFSPATPLLSPYRLHDLMISISGSDTKVIRGRTGHPELNGFYNRAKVCINIHNRQSGLAVSPRSFEILGSGGLLLTDRAIPMADDLKAGRDYLLYSDEMDMIEKIRWVMQNKDMATEIARRGHEAAKQGHTYVHRARLISDELAKHAP